MSKVGIITNPHAKLNKRNPNRPELLGYILGEKGFCEITRSLADLEQAALRFKNQGVDIIAINGGDGTISRTLTAIAHQYGEDKMPKIMLLRGGTMNVTALNLGIRGKPETLLTALIEAISTTEDLPTTSVYSLKIGGMLGFMYADGSSATILGEYYKNKSGTLGAIFFGVTLSFSSLWQGDFFRRMIEGDQYKITNPGGDILFEGASLGTFASTLKYLPLRIPMFLLADKIGPQFEHVIINAPRERLLYQLPGIMLNKRSGQSQGKFVVSTSGALVHTERNKTYTLDGELFDSPPEGVKIELGPKLEFVTLKKGWFP